MKRQDSPETTHPVAVRRLRSAAYALWMAGWAMAHAPLAAQSIDRPDPGTGDPGGQPATPPTLSLSNPRLEVNENRAYIPLFFSLNGSPWGTNDLRVRARFAGGTATPGEDFDLADAFRDVPLQGGLNSLNWITVPLIQDDVAEPDETALFDLWLEGSTAEPLRMEVLIRDDMAIGEVGFISTRFSANEGAPNGQVVVRMWRTLNMRNAATVTYRLEGDADVLAALGGEATRTAVFQPGDSQVFVSIPIMNDTKVQGTRDITLVIESSSDGMKPMKGFEKTVLTLADDETKPEAGALTIMEGASDAGERGVAISTLVPRGYQVRLEYSDTGVEGPWKVAWILQGSDVERIAFNRFDASLMRMFRLQPPEPLDMTLPW